MPQTVLKFRSDGKHRVRREVLAREHVCIISQLDMGRPGGKDGSIGQQHAWRIEVLHGCPRLSVRRALQIRSDHQTLLWIGAMYLLRGVQYAGVRFVTIP